MKPNLTLKQLAKELNVSVSTVSKALNNSPEISEPTRIKIQNYAKENNYKRNFFGLNLKSKTTKTIALIIPNVKNSFFIKVFSGIEKVAEANGYNVITCISKENIAKEIQILNMLSNGTVDGFVLSFSEEAQKLNQFDHINQVIDQGIPIVMFDRITDQIVCDKVIVNNHEGSQNATLFLLKEKPRTLALFSSISHLSVGKLRIKGYQDALEQEGFDKENSYVIATDSVTDFDQKTVEFLSQNKPDAIFTTDEYASFKVLKTALEKGFKIPEELQIIGFADGIWSRRMTPSLTTVSQHCEKMGEIAASLLIDKLQNQNAKDFETIIIDTQIKQRDSTRK